MKQVWINEITKKNGNQCREDKEDNTYSNERYVKMKEKQKQLQQQQQQELQEQLKQTPQQQTPHPEKPQVKQKQQQSPQQQQQKQTPPQPIPRKDRKSSIVEGMVPVAKPRRPKSEIIKEPENTFFEVSKDRAINDLFVSVAEDHSTEDEYEAEETGEYVGFKSITSGSYPGKGNHDLRIQSQKTRACSTSNECSSMPSTSESSKNEYESIPSKDCARKTQSLDLRRKFSKNFAFLRRNSKITESSDEKDAEEHKEKGKAYKH